MIRCLAALVVSLTWSLSLSRAGAIPAQLLYYRPPVLPEAALPPPEPPAFVGSRYSFARPSRMSNSYYLPNYNTPMFYSPRYVNPGPYYFTPCYSYTPGYYSYYYTPGYFRY